MALAAAGAILSRTLWAIVITLILKYIRNLWNLTFQLVEAIVHTVLHGLHVFMKWIYFFDNDVEDLTFFGKHVFDGGRFNFCEFVEIQIMDLFKGTELKIASIDFDFEHLIPKVYFLCETEQQLNVDHTSLIGTLGN